jgi:hypothetical protein
MTDKDFLKSFEALGISLSSERGRLIVEAPTGVLTPQLREELVRRKSELIAALEGRRQSPADLTLPDAQNEIARLLTNI